MTMTAVKLDLGLQEYGEVWDLQHRLVELRRQDAIPDTLIFVEHPHVITLGRRGQRDDVLADDLPVFAVERGGEATYHGPGQLVAYPILKLRDRLDVRRLVTDLEEVLIRACGDFGLEASRNPEQRGVWVGRRKLSSIGLAVHENVTYHGLAHNVNTDLSYFLKLRPCGASGERMTSMAQELGHGLDMAAVKSGVAARFSDVFGLDLRERGSEELLAAIA